jgi:hypothetical protein
MDERNLHLAGALHVAVAPARRRLGDVDGIGARKGLFEPLLQRFVEAMFFGCIAGFRLWPRSGHGDLLANDLAVLATMLDDHEIL